MTSTMALRPEIHDLLSLIARRKGWATPDHIAPITNNHASLPGLQDAVSRLTRAIDAGDVITICTDFDADGLTGGLLFYAGLAQLGGAVNLVVPDYHGERNITASDIDHAVKLYPDTTIIITCDVGIASHEGIAHAHTRGLEVIVTDHHTEDPHALCHADVVVNPNRVGSTYPQPHICGAQVAHLILSQLARQRNEYVTAIDLLAVFAGIGALADVMPLTGQTRATVNRALALLRLSIPLVPTSTDGAFLYQKADRIIVDSAPLYTMASEHGSDWRYLRLFHGLSLLMRQLISARKLTRASMVDASFIGFTLAPMINATRRVGGDVHDTVRIFAPQVTEPTEPAPASRAESVTRLIDNNMRRQRQTSAGLEAMLAADQPHAPYVWFSDAPAGMLGLLAARMCEQFNTATVVVNPDTKTGSARAPEGIDVLAACLDHPALWAAGHPQACGVRADDPAALATVLHHATAVAHETTDPNDSRADLALTDIASFTGLNTAACRHIKSSFDSPVLPTDAEFQLLAERLATLAPFGEGFDYPDITLTCRSDELNVSTLGKHGQHRKIITPSGFTVLWWNADERLDDVTDDDPMMVAFSVEIGVNTFANTTTAQAIVRSLAITPFTTLNAIADNTGEANHSAEENHTTSEALL